MSKTTVLIVEDEAIIALDLQQSIEDLGYDTLTAFSVTEALCLLDTRSINFAVLDYHVGTSDTGELAERLIAKRIPFVVCSGTEVDRARDVFRDAALLPKPFSFDQLRSAMAEVLH
jgi:DNA-binding NtrC family response regulator